MRILDKGSLELKNVSASDFSVVAAARVSNGVEFDEASKGAEADRKLINYLMKHKHGTPFEHNLFTFYVDTPLFVRSEWERHRVGWSYNEISRRYVDSPPKFYIPDRWRVRGSTSKQGSSLPSEEFLKEWHDKYFNWVEEHNIRGNVTKIDHSPIMEDWNAWQTYLLRTQCSYLLEAYQEMLDNGVAPEMARMVLPQNMYTQLYATCNARSLMHFLNLRNHMNAQFEIQQYAAGLEDLFQKHMPITYQAFLDNGRVAP